MNSHTDMGSNVDNADTDVTSGGSNRTVTDVSVNPNFCTPGKQWREARV